MNTPTNSIKTRRVVHFAGFEPLDHLAHRIRYKRALSQSCRAFGFKSKLAETVLKGTEQGEQFPQFSVSSNGPNWQTESHITILEHNELILERLARPVWSIILSGYYAALMVVLYNGLFNYARLAWRVALFFLFPFMFMAAGFFMAFVFAALPTMFGWPAWHILWSAPMALLLFVRVFLPFAGRFHILLLFANCRMSIELVAKKSELLQHIQERYVRNLSFVLSQPADEYLISSHSMGGSLLIDALGSVLKANPSALDGKRIVICSMGGAGFQCTLLRPAKALRQKLCLIIDNPNVFWVDVQCLTDYVSYYKVSFASAFKTMKMKSQNIVFIRMKQMVSPKSYMKLKKDGLHMHRQYVLGSELRSKFDYSVMTVAPFLAERFATFTPDNLPPFGPDGALVG